MMIVSDVRAMTAREEEGDDDVSRERNIDIGGRGGRKPG